MLSPAIVAVTRQVPADVDDSTPVATAHPDAVPAETAYDTTPLVDPPDADNVTPDPYVPDVDVTVNAA